MQFHIVASSVTVCYCFLCSLSNQIIMIVFDCVCVVCLKSNFVLFLVFFPVIYPFCTHTHTHLCRMKSQFLIYSICFLFLFFFFLVSGHIRLQFTHFHCFALVIPMNTHRKEKRERRVHIRVCVFHVFIV